MSDPVNLQELLSKPLSDFPDLPQLPGNKHFYGKIIGMSAGHSQNKGTPLYHFNIRLTDPGQDISDAEKAAIAAAGFSLADYTCGADFYLTPLAMKMLRRFLVSLGFSENVSFRENLALADDGNPTAETQEKIRGLDVLVKTPPADEQGRVFLNRVDTVTGVKR